MSYPSFSDASWSLIYKFLQECDDIYTGKEAKLRHFMNAILYVTRSGVQWRLLPTEFGKWNSVYDRFNEWRKKGIWQRMFEHFSTDNDLEMIMIDATIMRAHACAAGAKKGAKLLVVLKEDSLRNCTQW